MKNETEISTQFDQISALRTINTKKIAIVLSIVILKGFLSPVNHLAHISGYCTMYGTGIKQTNT